jgi:hypothetical protein
MNRERLTAREHSICCGFRVFQPEQGICSLAEAGSEARHNCITADGNIEPLVLTSNFHEKELQIIGSSDGWDYLQHAAWYHHKVQQRSTHLEQLFELRTARDELISTFEQLAQGDIHPSKVFVSCDNMPGVSDEHVVLDK